jgi:hypothetical protein
VAVALAGGASIALVVWFELQAGTHRRLDGCWQTAQDAVLVAGWTLYSVLLLRRDRSTDETGTQEPLAAGRRWRCRQEARRSRG